MNSGRLGGKGLRKKTSQGWEPAATTSASAFLNRDQSHVEGHFQCPCPRDKGKDPGAAYSCWEVSKYWRSLGGTPFQKEGICCRPSGAQKREWATEPVSSGNPRLEWSQLTPPALPPNPHQQLILVLLSSQTQLISLKEIKTQVLGLASLHTWQLIPYLDVWGEKHSTWILAETNLHLG